MNCAPVCVFTYKRYDHTVKMLEALAENTLAADSDLYIFCDNYRKETDRDKVNQVREYVKEFKARNLFKTTTVEFAETNKGLAKSIIDGATKIMNQYGSVIVLEDDLLTSKYCLSYFNRCLDYFKDDERIWAISGYTFPLKSLSNFEHDVYLSYRGCSWGWATWKDRWATVDWDVKDYKKFLWNPFLRRSFARGGNDMPAMLDRQMNHFIDSWAIRWCYSQWKQNKYTVYPKESRIFNMGLDGSGTHGNNTRKFNTPLCTSQQLKLEKIDVDDVICNEFRNINHVPFYKCVLSFIKNNILHTKYLKPRFLVAKH